MEPVIQGSIYKTRPTFLKIYRPLVAHSIQKQLRQQFVAIARAKYQLIALDVAVYGERTP